MARIACLWVPDLAVAALLRTEPELRGSPLAITDGHGVHSRVLALSSQARQAGLRLGMTPAQARAAGADVVVRARVPEAIRAASNALADVAASISARVELDEEAGVVFLDIAGSAALCASENGLATILIARAERQGLTTCVGIGGSKLVAELAARHGRGVSTVPPGGDGAYLAPLPIAMLDPDVELAALLTSWGIHRIGDLAALPAGEVGHRLGSAGARLIRRARGEDDLPLQSRPALASFVEAVELDHAIDRTEPLLFLTHRLIDHMMGRLALQGLACTELEVGLMLASGGRDSRRLTIAAPTTESKVLLTLIRADLDRRPPAHGVTGIHLSGIPGRRRPVQLDFFRPNGPSSTALAVTMARLATLCGPDRVGAPLRVDSHRPDAVAVTAFPGGSMSPPSLTGPRVALRAFRPPIALEVFEGAGRLDYVRGSVFGGRVVHLAGPWQLRGEWWAADPYAREYYDVELSDGGVYRIYRDLRTQRWLADGAYD